MVSQPCKAPGQSLPEAELGLDAELNEGPCNLERQTGKLCERVLQSSRCQLRRTLALQRAGVVQGASKQMAKAPLALP
eukprot:9164542-Lingulodinium_polyedra.AAC.1